MAFSIFRVDETFLTGCCSRQHSIQIIRISCGGSTIYDINSGYQKFIHSLHQGTLAWDNE